MQEIAGSQLEDFLSRKRKKKEKREGKAKEFAAVFPIEIRRFIKEERKERAEGLCLVRC